MRAVSGFSLNYIEFHLKKGKRRVSLLAIPCFFLVQKSVHTCILATVALRHYIQNIFYVFYFMYLSIAFNKN